MNKGNEPIWSLVEQTKWSETKSGQGSQDQGVKEMEGVGLLGTNFNQLDCQMGTYHKYCLGMAINYHGKTLYNIVHSFFTFKFARLPNE